MSFRRQLRFVMLVGLASFPVNASAQNLAAKAEPLFAWTAGTAPGCAVAAAHDGKVVLSRAWGLADLARGTPLSTGSLLDAGSVQKQFVAAAVLRLAEQGRVRLDDDIRSHIPELHDYGHRITVHHLLTHTSGLRDWVNVRQFSRDKPDALTLILRQRALDFAPGEEWSYSNSGYVLLKELVRRVSGTSFGDFARVELFEPLGLAATVHVDDELAEDPRVAQAYEQRGDAWEPAVLEGTARGGHGILYTTASDLLTWNLALSEGRLGSFVTDGLRAPTRLNNGRVIGYGRGLFIEENGDETATWHTGSAGAYKTVVATFPAEGVSLAVMCNAGDTQGAMRFATQLRRLMAPEVAAREATAADTAPASFDASGRDGLWLDIATGEPLRLVAREGRLLVEGGPALVAVGTDRLRPVEPALTYRSQDAFELHFAADGTLTFTSMEGVAKRYRRAVAEPPTPEDVAMFAGAYESAALNAVIHIAAGERGLTAALNGSRPVPLVPADRDLYSLGRMLMHFTRDADGNVTGITYRNPVIRSERFARLVQ